MLTADLEKAEKDVTTLKRENERLADEKATLQSRASKEKQELIAELEKLKLEHTSALSSYSDLKIKLRNMEQANDDLERRQREGSSAVESTEANLELVIEEKVMLEADLEDAVTEGREKEQRLRDEIRDLSSELTITKAKLTPRPGVPGLSLSGLQTPGTPGAPMTPASASAASPLSTRGLAVIGDMLQRVKDMEERLAGCRSSLGQMLSERKTPVKTPLRTPVKTPGNSPVPLQATP